MRALPLTLLALLAIGPAPAPAQSGEADKTTALFAAVRAARAEGRYGMLLRQFRADEPTLGEHHEAGAKPATAAYRGTRDIPAGYWVWQRPYWFVFRDGPDHVAQDRNWGPEAACGMPNTPAPGDHVTAWATRGQDDPGEWLLLEYLEPVRLAAIEIHETYRPGAIASIAIFTPQGDELELWSNPAVGPSRQDGNVLRVDLPVGFVIERVKLYLASERVPSWNEIDAVGLRDLKGAMHWASRAAASSTFAERDAPVQGAPAKAAAIPRAAAAPQPAEAALQARIAELEATVQRLQAEVARLKAAARR